MNQFKFIKNAEDFHKSRSKKIGASDLPILCGLSSFTTPHDLWLQKTGRIDNFTGNDATRWGHNLEPIILASYVESITDKKTSDKFLLDYIKNQHERKENYKPKTIFYPFTEFYHEQVTWAISHPDLVDMNNQVLIEAKSGRRYASFRRDDFDGFDPDDKTENGVPLKYYIQCQWQMLTSGIDTNILRALIDTNTELSYEIKYNKKIAEKLLDIASRFMYCIEKDIEPAPTTSDDIAKIFPIVNDKASYLTPIESEFARKMKSRKDYLSSKKKHIEKEINDINNSLSVLIKDNKILYDDAGKKICGQVMFSKEIVKGLEEIKKAGLYDLLKEKDLIKSTEVRYVR